MFPYSYREYNTVYLLFVHLYVALSFSSPINMKSDSDIESDAGTNNDDKFSSMSSVYNEFDMTEDNSLPALSREKYNSSPDSSVQDRSDGSISPQKCQGNE